MAATAKVRKVGHDVLPGAEPERMPGRGINVVRSLRAHLRVSLLIFAIVAGVLGPLLAWSKGKHFYSAEAVLYISPRFERNLELDQELEMQSNQQYREFVQQQVRTINRFDIVEEALKKLGNDRFLWQDRKEPDRIAVERIQGQLEVKSIADTYQVTVAMESPKQKGLAELVNSVVQSYIEKFRNEELHASGDRVKNLIAERQNLLQEMARRNNRRTELAQNLGVTTFNDSNPNPYDQILLRSKDALAAARRQRFDAEALLGAVNSVERTGGDSALASMAQDVALRDAGLTTLKANVNQHRADLLARRSGLSPQHIGFKAINEELAQMDAEVARVNQGLVEQFAKVLVEQKQAEVYRCRRLEAELSNEMEVQSREASAFTAGFQEAMECGRDLERLRKRLNAVEDRIDFLSLEKQAPGFVRLFAAARTPMVPSRAGHKKLLMLMVVGGLVLALVLPIGIDLLDPRVLVANDLHNVLGFPPVGWTPEHEPQTEPLQREQIRRLAGQLRRDHLEQRSQLFLFTGTGIGVGVTSLVLDLAEDLTRLGLRVAAIEANAFHRDSRFGTHPGLQEVLRDEASLSGIDPWIRGDNGPLMLPVGGEIEERQLGEPGKLPQFLASVATRVDLVLIDAAPLLLSADTELLVGQTDVTVLVAEAEATTRTEVTTAARRLQQLRPAAFAGMLTRVRLTGTRDAGERMALEYKTRERVQEPWYATPWLWR